MEPWPARRVSCMAAMSTLSRWSSLLITAVFLMFLMLLTSSSIPVFMVRTFQLPSLRAGLFLRLCLFWLSGATLAVHLLAKLYFVSFVSKVTANPQEPSDKGELWRNLLTGASQFFRVYAEEKLECHLQGAMPGQVFWKVQLLPMQQDSTLHINE